MKPISYQTILEEALRSPSWKIDPRRACRALGILLTHQSRTMLKLARQDEDGKPISSADNIWQVRSSRQGWYHVRPDDRSCTCPDSRAGQICKHRLAVYLYQTQIERTRSRVIEESQHNSTPEQILTDLGF